eukprot:UN29566
MSARVHPGEVPSSFVMEGVLSFLTGQDSRAKMLRDMFIFIIIPMINPDGVIKGHQRTNISGHNLNRIYHNPKKDLHPVIYHIKNDVLNLYSDRLTYYFDLHAHARSRGCFFYGIPSKDEDVYFKSLLFPKLAELNHYALQFHKRNFTANLMVKLDKNGE